MLKKRVATAAVLIPALTAAVIWLPAVWLAVVFAAVVLTAAWEWMRLSGIGDDPMMLPLRALYVFWYGAVMAMLYGWPWGEAGGVGWLYAAGVWWASVLAWLVWARASGWSGPAVSADDEAPLDLFDSYAFAMSMRMMMGYAVLLPAWFAVVRLGGQESGRGLLLALFAIVWAADSGAYFVGRAWGRRRLASAISPGKTVEGAYGGLAAAALAAFGAAAAFVGVGVVGAVFSIVGDLQVSVLKRAAGVKDSGALFPGHGGALDRIDSLTAAAVVYALGLDVVGLHSFAGAAG